MESSSDFSHYQVDEHSENSYYPNGAIKSKKIRDSRNLLEIIYFYHHSDSTNTPPRLLFKRYRQNDILFEEEYNTDGTLKSMGKHKIEKVTPNRIYTADGMRISFFYKTTDKKQEFTCTDLRNEGKTTIYFRSGQKRVETSILNGKYQGLTFEYYPNGRIHREYTYSSGKITGIYKLYFRSGMLNFYQQMKDDLRHGIGKNYYENGGIEEIVEYHHNKKVGAWLHFDSNGLLEYYDYYVDDQYKGRFDIHEVTQNFILMQNNLKRRREDQNEEHVKTSENEPSKITKFDLNEDRDDNDAN